MLVHELNHPHEASRGYGHVRIEHQHVLSAGLQKAWLAARPKPQVRSVCHDAGPGESARTLSALPSADALSITTMSSSVPPCSSTRALTQDSRNCLVL